MKSLRILAVFLLVLFCLIGILAVILTSSWPLEKFLSYKIEHDNPIIKVESLLIAEHAIEGGGAFIMKGINASLLLDGKKTDVKIGEVRLQDLRTLIVPNRVSHFSVKAIEGSQESLKFKDATAELTYRGTKEQWELRGDVAIATLELAGQTIKDATFKIESNERELSLKDVRLSLSEGSVKGDLVLTLTETMPYDLNLELSRVPAKNIALENFSLESQLRGLINGHLSLSGDTQRISHIDAQLEAPNGMYMNAQLLGFLLSYIPQSTQKQQIEKLIKEGKNIYIDKFKLDIMNDNSELMKTSFGLKSIEYNLDVNLGVDVNVEGGMMALLKQGLSFIPKEEK